MNYNIHIDEEIFQGFLNSPVEYIWLFARQNKMVG